MSERALADTKLGSQTTARLREAFERSRNPMLLADDQRRWITGNAAAAHLLGIAREEIHRHTMDEFTHPSELARFREQWKAFLARGAAEGGFELHVPNRGRVPVEFSATANVLPGRHLSVFIPHDGTPGEHVRGAQDAAWKPVGAEGSASLELTERECEVMTLVASGLRGEEMAAHLLLSPEILQTHVHNVMAKLGVHTSAHAVSIALLTGQLNWTSVGRSPTVGTGLVGRSNAEQVRNRLFHPRRRSGGGADRLRG
jgi:PAS domain S-box-containing protein